MFAGDTPSILLAKCIAIKPTLRARCVPVPYRFAVYRRNTMDTDQQGLKLSNYINQPYHAFITTEKSTNKSLMVAMLESTALITGQTTATLRAVYLVGPLPINESKAVISVTNYIWPTNSFASIVFDFNFSWSFSGGLGNLKFCFILQKHLEEDHILFLSHTMASNAEDLRAIVPLDGLRFLRTRLCYLCCAPTDHATMSDLTVYLNLRFWHPC